MISSGSSVNCCLSSSYRRRYPEGASITIHRRRAPAVAALADELVSSGEYEGLVERELPEVVAALWSRLSRSLT